MSPTPPPPGSRTTAAIPDADLFLSDIARGRETPPERRMRDGVRLFEMACRSARAGLRHRHPDADEAEIGRLLSDRIARGRRLEQHGVYSFRPMTAEEAGLAD